MCDSYPRDIYVSYLKCLLITGRILMYDITVDEIREIFNVENIHITPYFDRREGLAPVTLIVCQRTNKILSVLLEQKENYVIDVDDVIDFSYMYVSDKLIKATNYSTEFTKEAQILCMLRTKIREVSDFKSLIPELLEIFSKDTS